MRDLWAITERPLPGGEQVVWALPTPGPREKLHGRHPTQKPLALLERAIAASAAAGDLVVDPFSGSGTTGVAAVQAGCRFLGIERDAEYVQLASSRLRALDEPSLPSAPGLKSDRRSSAETRVASAAG
jgi:site-specific DNA-methyltransferase (adenine-specific)